MRQAVMRLVAFAEMRRARHRLLAYVEHGLKAEVHVELLVAMEQRQAGHLRA